MPRTHTEDRGLIATAEDAEEEVSVSDRFGLWVGFPAMDQPTYLEAVRGYVARYGLATPDLATPDLATPDLATPDLERRALQWAQLRGGRSGRIAWQFIRDLAGEQGKPLPL
jgi:predicted AAA+ superfamily ATPase